MSRSLSPEKAADALEKLHGQAVAALAAAVRRYVEGGAPPTPEERARFRYPELRITYAPDAPPPRLARAYAQLIWSGDYVASITQPAFFRDYLIEQMRLLEQDYGVTIEVRLSDAEIPYSFGLDGASDIDLESVSAAELARLFPHPRLALVGDAGAT